MNPPPAATAASLAEGGSSARLQWERDGLDWPHRDASRFVDAGGVRWHVQQFDTAPTDHPPQVALLLHGTGASSHSWCGLAPLLAQHATVLSLDLPGHGFTSMPARGASGLTLPGMARALRELLARLHLAPTVIVGHSAGAAVAVRMCLDGLAAPGLVFSVNGALLPLAGLVGQMFSPVARLMAATPFVPRVFSWHANDPAVLQRLVDATGSALDPAGVALYGRLVRNPGHAAAALQMMARWDLQTLSHDLRRLRTPLHLLVGANDRTVAPRQAQRVQAMLGPEARAHVTTLPGLGHLAHEERPDLVAAAVLAALPGVRLPT